MSTPIFGKNETSLQYQQAPKSFSDERKSMERKAWSAEKDKFAVLGRKEEVEVKVFEKKTGGLGDLRMKLEDFRRESL